MNKDIRVLISEDDIKKRVDALAAEILAHYEGRPITAIVALRGAVFFAADLLRKLTTEVEMDFVKVSFYGDGTTPTHMNPKPIDFQIPIEGQDVLLIDDIIDTGVTIGYLIDEIKAKNPRSFKICVLLNKDARRTVNIRADYIGFDVPNEFVIGYGLDVAQKYRNLPYIGVIDGLK